jgi:cytochrome c peroxidase
MTEQHQTSMAERHGREDRVRVQAYHMWEQAGAPADNAHEHWFRAEAVIDEEAKREAALDEAVAGSFPASDPLSATQTTTSGADKRGN